MRKLTRAISAVIAAAMALSGLTCVVRAETVTAVPADKTAEWTYQEKAAGYNLRVHGWADWENAAYMGFTLPDGFDPDKITKAELIVNTTDAKNSGTAYIYAADYGAFENGTQYEGTSAAPAYTAAEFKSFVSPVSTGDFAIDVTDYITSLSAQSKNAAFRIDVKSQNTNNAWSIAPCGANGAPRLELTIPGEGETPKGIQNPRFSNGLTGWTVSEGGTASADTGELIASGTVHVSQTVTGLEPGTYNLTAQAYTSEIKTTGTSYLYAKTKGHTVASTAIPEGSAAYKIIVPSVVVGEDGTCDIGLNLVSSASVTLDNLAFEKTEDTRVKFYKGGEISKLTYIESKNGLFRRIGGTTALNDALQVMAENGFNLARIRLLDSPGKGHGDGTYYLPAGFMDLDDCLSLARRAKDKGMDIELTIAYSDYWVDGATQMVPYNWQQEITAQGITGAANLANYFEDKVYEYTKESLQAFIDQGTTPEFVSIGNEMQYGILFNKYQSNNGLYNNASYLKRFVNAGAKAVRELAPDAKIIIHSDNGGKVSSRGTFMSLVKDTTVDYDVIGVSYYPFYNADVSIDTVVNEFNTFVNTYKKDVIIMETGYNWNPTKKGGWEGQLENSGYYQDIYGEDQAGQRAFLTELYAKLKTVLGGRCIGDLYWDPVMIPASGVRWAEAENGSSQSEVVSNSTLFNFNNAQAVPGQLAMKYNTEASDMLNISGRIKTSTASTAYAKNTEVTFTVNGDQYTRTTDKYGDYIVSIPYPEDGKVSISLKGSATSYTDEAAPTYEGILMSGYNFDDFDPTAEPTESPNVTPTAAPTGTPEASVEPVETATPEPVETSTPEPVETATPEPVETATPEGAYVNLDVQISVDGQISYKADYYADGAENATLYVAVYDQNGKLIAVYADKPEGVIENINYIEDYQNGQINIKGFLWDDAQKPLCDDYVEIIA